MAKWLKTFASLHDDRDTKHACDTENNGNVAHLIDYETRSRCHRLHGVYFNEDNSIVISGGFNRQVDRVCCVSAMAEQFAVTKIKELPQLYTPTGEKAPKAWMENYNVVVDYEHDRVLFADDWHSYIRYETPDAVPDSKFPLVVNVHDRKLIKVTLKALADQREAAKAAARLHSDQRRYNAPNSREAILNLDIMCNLDITLYLGALTHERWLKDVTDACTTPVKVPYLKLTP